ncbi:hypothetical protein BLOT_011336 [Blomia tropicalis]|nr:hypothetical protein BLOT_011336 [Blomia tropicalis]
MLITTNGNELLALRRKKSSAEEVGTHNFVKIITQTKQNINFFNLHKHTILTQTKQNINFFNLHKVILEQVILGIITQTKQNLNFFNLHQVILEQIILGIKSIEMIDWIVHVINRVDWIVHVVNRVDWIVHVINRVDWIVHVVNRVDWIVHVINWVDWIVHVINRVDWIVHVVNGVDWIVHVINWVDLSVNMVFRISMISAVYLLKQIFTGSEFEETFKQLKFVPFRAPIESLSSSLQLTCPIDGCKDKQRFLNDSYVFERHIESKHKNEFMQIVNRWNNRVNAIQQQMDVSEENVTIGHEESSTQFMQINLQEIQEILEIGIDHVISGESYDFDFYAELTSTHSQQEVDFANMMFDEVLKVKKQCMSLPASVITSIASQLLETFETLLDRNKCLNDRILNFVGNPKLHRELLFKFGTYIPEIEIMINGECAGYRVSLKKLSSMILRNSKIVESILCELKQKSTLLSIENFEIYHSDLTCCKERFNRLSGNLRVEIGFDDFTVTKEAHHKYFVMYASFTNIPIKRRLKREDKIDHEKLNITVDDICRPIVEELKELDSVGTDVKVFLKNGSSHIMNIRTVLASLVGDNLGVYEMLGYTKTFGLGFICRICGSNHEEYKPTLNSNRLDVMRMRMNIQMFSNQ